MVLSGWVRIGRVLQFFAASPAAAPGGCGFDFCSACLLLLDLYRLRCLPGRPSAELYCGGDGRCIFVGMDGWPLAAAGDGWLLAVYWKNSGYCPVAISKNFHFFP